MSHSTQLVVSLISNSANNLLNRQGRGTEVIPGGVVGVNLDDYENELVCGSGTQPVVSAIVQGSILRVRFFQICVDDIVMKFGDKRKLYFAGDALLDDRFSAVSKPILQLNTLILKILS